MMSTDNSTSNKGQRGRPRSATAASHEVILDAVYQILQEKSVRSLTIEEVAKRAGVGKPTIYKWWPSKAALVMDMFEERIMETLPVSEGKTAEESIRAQVAEMIQLLNGFFGKLAAEIIAEGQSEPEVLTEYHTRYLTHRRGYTRRLVEQAKANGEFCAGFDTELLIDMVYGPIYYRLLIRHQTLDQEFGEELVDRVMASVKL